ncbi:non-specific lipid-transfer protein 1-like [Rutidosis leptorrhynchoides]|uniref:non-specific lipid-transfer protein 1-like n=1 Tax=Rutidosis leptorrhynchoides TaxID=125765 RepID=UPI003A996679
MTIITMKVLCVAMACMVTMVPNTEAEITCDDFDKHVPPCVKYVRGVDEVPSKECCNKLKESISTLKTRLDNEMACKCMVNAHSQIPDIKPDNARNLPNKCNVNVPFKTGLDTNCDKYYAMNKKLAVIYCFAQLKDCHAKIAIGADVSSGPSALA